MKKKRQERLEAAVCAIMAHEWRLQCVWMDSPHPAMEEELEYLHMLISDLSKIVSERRSWRIVIK